MGTRLTQRIKTAIMVGTGLALSLLCQEAANTTNDDPASSLNDAPKELRIGSLLPATGDLSALGAPMIAAVPLLVDQVNGCGGVNGASVTLIPNVDDQTDNAVGSAGMRHLVAVEKVAGVVGSFASGVSSKALTEAVRRKVMLISPGSSSPRFTDRAKAGEFQGYWARTALSDIHQVPALAKFAYARGFRTIGIIYINNDYGIPAQQQFIKTFKSLGGKITHEANPAKYDPNAITSAFKDKPDAVVIITYGEHGLELLREISKQPLSQGVPILSLDGMYEVDLAKKVGRSADGKFIAAGMLGTIPGARDTLALKDFAKIWQDQMKRPLEPYAPQAWDAAALLVLAAEASKQNTGAGIESKIREVANAPGEEVSDVCTALKLLREGKDINYQGASGNVDLDANGDVLGSYDIWTIKDDGKISTIGNVVPTANK